MTRAPRARWAAIAAALLCAHCARDVRRIPLLDAPVLLTPEPTALMLATPLPVGRGRDRLCVTVPAGWTRAPDRGALLDRAGRVAVLGAALTLGDGRTRDMRFAGFRGGTTGGYCLVPMAPGADSAGPPPPLPSPVIALRVWSSVPVRVTQIHWIDARRTAADSLSALPSAPPPAPRR